MKRKNALTAGVIGFSIFALAGIAPMSVANAMTGAVSIDDTQDAKAIEIIEASIEASGGRDLLSEAKYMKQSGTISVPMAGITGTLESFAKTPGNFLLVINLPGIGEQRTGMHDGVAWSSDVMNGPRLLPDEEAESLKEEADLTNRLKYKEQYPTIEYKGEVDFDGAKANKIRLVDKNGDETIEYYSVESKLQVGNEATVPSQMGPTKTISYLREYKDIEGVMIPTKMVQKIGPQEIQFEFKTVSFDAFDDSVFALPDAVKALVEAQKKDD